jgi:hypothetical protein
MGDIYSVLEIYLTILGALLFLLAMLEFFFPLVIFRIWQKWLNHKLFPLHGVILMAGGLPATLFRDTIAGKLMLIVGIVIVFSGPFVLFFADRVRHYFYESIKELNNEELKHLVYVDAVMRGLVGLLFFFTMLSKSCSH